MLTKKVRLKVERYLHGPIPGSASDNLSPGEVSAITRNILLECRQWQGGRYTHTTLVSPAAAVGALGELSPGGALMRGFQEQSLARKCSKLTIGVLVTFFLQQSLCRVISKKKLGICTCLYVNCCITSGSAFRQILRVRSKKW